MITLSLPSAMFRHMDKQVLMKPYVKVQNDPLTSWFYKAPSILVTHCTFTPTSEKALLPLLCKWEESWDGYATRPSPHSDIPWEERTTTDNVRNSRKDAL